MRLGFLLAGHFLGVWGVMIGLVLVLLDLCGHQQLRGCPLLSPHLPP